VGHLCLSYYNLFNPLIISIAALDNVPPDARLQKKSTISTLNFGLDGMGNRARFTCLASSGTIRSAIHYASLFSLSLFLIILFFFLSLSLSLSLYFPYFNLDFNNDSVLMRRKLPKPCTYVRHALPLSISLSLPLSHHPHSLSFSLSLSLSLFSLSLSLSLFLSIRTLSLSLSLSLSLC
jgi:hypothetical protein